MSKAVDEQTRPKLSALERLELLRDAPVDWNDPDWARTWVEEGRREGHVEGRVAERKEILDVIRECLHREAEAKFDQERAGWLMAGLAQKSDLALLMEIATQIREGTPYATLLKRLANGS